MSDKELKQNLEEESEKNSTANDTQDQTQSTQEVVEDKEVAQTEQEQTTQEDTTTEQTTQESSDTSSNEQPQDDNDSSIEATNEANEILQETPNTPDEKVNYARKLVDIADSEVNECLDRVKKDIEEFQEYEKSSLAPIIEESRKLLDRLGIDSEDIGELPSLNADISPVENSEKLYINELPSGKGGAFFWGLIGGLATLAGWYAVGAKEAGVSIIPNSLDMATIDKVASKLAQMIGFGANPQLGLGVAIASALLIFIIIFSIKVSLQKAKNEEIAKELEEKAKEYKSKKDECKLNLDKIDEHIKELRDLALKYEVLLDEKNATIRRAIRIEGASTLSDLHESSKKEVEHLMTLIREIERLIEAPIVENGALSQHSANLLRDTKILLQKHIDNIYA